MDSEVFISLVDGKAAPYRSELRQLAITALCTNRDLPLQIPIGRGRTDFTMESVAPIESVRCVAGPTPPRPACMEGEIAWRAISHLSLNYLSLIDSSGGQGAAALRDLLKLYSDAHDPHIRKQIQGVLSIASNPVTRRIVTNGPLTFVRGVELIVTLDEKAFEGVGAFLFGSVLECFFAKYVSINSFTETVIKSKERGDLIRWPTRLGLQHVL
jgi:type VI secretion system protein ImpG